MAGEDLTSSVNAEPPRAPLADLTRDHLLALGADIVRETWAGGLPHWFWGEGVCLSGMVAFTEAGDGEFPSPVLEWLRERGPEAVVEHVNNVAPGIAAVRAAGRGHRDTEDVCRRLFDAIVRGEGTTYTSDGVIEHWPGGVWADTAYMAGVFLIEWGRHLRDPDIFASGVRQILGHYRVLQHSSGLCAHGSHIGSVIWCFWGRANAWLALAAVRTQEIAAEWPAVAMTPELQELDERLGRQLDALVLHQPSHGVWDVLVDGQPENRGILETSAAAGIGAALLRASRLNDAGGRWREPGELAIRGALAYVDQGIVTRVSAGTILQLIPFGYSVIRSDRPQLWGQGLALHAIAAALG